MIRKTFVILLAPPFFVGFLLIGIVMGIKDWMEIYGQRVAAAWRGPKRHLPEPKDQPLPSRTARKLLKPKTPPMPEGFGRVLTPEEIADSYCPERRERIEVAKVQLEHYRLDMPAEAYAAISKALES